MVCLPQSYTIDSRYSDYQFLYDTASIITTVLQAFLTFCVLKLFSLHVKFRDSQKLSVACLLGRLHVTLSLRSILAFYGQQVYTTLK